jgi:hypothetical protein
MLRKLQTFSNEIQQKTGDSGIDPRVQRLENWMPGIGEPTEVHDFLHQRFDLGFTLLDEAKILGFQLGHSGEGNLLHLLFYSLVSTTLYPASYRHPWSDIPAFWKAYIVGEAWSGVPYHLCPRGIL